MKLLFLLLLTILIAGCTASTRSYGGLSVSMESDPQTIYSSDSAIVYLDIKNNGVRTLYDINANIFESGFLVNDCDTKNIPFILPDQKETIRCDMSVDASQFPPDESRVSTAIDASVSFSSSLEVLQRIELISIDEYERRKAIGSLSGSSKKYTYRDDYIEMLVEFSDEVPLVMRNKNMYMYITIKNIGNGFVSDLTYGKVRVDSEILDCRMNDLYATGKTFPKITCPINLNIVDDIINKDVPITVSYEYEIRAGTNVNIIR